MFKRALIASAILIASTPYASAQDIFWSFSPTEVVSTSTVDFVQAGVGSVYIFSDGLFSFDALDLDFTLSDPSVIRFTGGESFNPTFNVIGGTRFDFSELTIDSTAASGKLFSLNVIQNGVNAALGPMFDPDFEAGIGLNGAFLLARVDYEIVGRNSTVDLDFTLGFQGALELSLIHI